jgi:magnesium and cobalt transporter
MIRMGSARGAMASEKTELLTSVIEFSETMVREILVPRTDVIALPVDATRDEVVRLVLDRKFTRIPIFDQNLDSIVGIVNVKDLLPSLFGNGGDLPLRQLATQHKTLFVPESKKIGELLKEFQRERAQMAVVVDEFGGTAGIVTLEDVIEEIVGEIYDEHDKAEAPIRPDGDGYLVQARAAIEDVADVFDVVLPEQDLYETAGGLVMTEAGRLPTVGEAVELEGLRFEVRERTRTRLVTLHVKRVEDHPVEEAVEEAKESR